MCWLSYLHLSLEYRYLAFHTSACVFVCVHFECDARAGGAGGARHVRNVKYNSTLNRKHAHIKPLLTLHAPLDSRAVQGTSQGGRLAAIKLGGGRGRRGGSKTSSSGDRVARGRGTPRVSWSNNREFVHCRRIHRDVVSGCLWGGRSCSPHKPRTSDCVTVYRNTHSELGLKFCQRSPKSSIQTSPPPHHLQVRRCDRRA